VRANPDDLIARFGERQHGVVTRTQLIGAGVTGSMIQTRLRAGRLRQVHRGVYLLGRLHGRLEPKRARMMAAVLAAGKGTVLSHTSAASLWDMVHRPAVDHRSIHITVPSDRRRRLPGIRVHRSALGHHERAVRDRVPVTTPARTLIDLSTVATEHEVNRAAARAERLGLITSTELAALSDRYRGRAGTPRLRAALGADGGAILTRSEAEERFLALIDRGGLRKPEANVALRGHEVDFLWRSEAVVVEVDGFAYHASRRSFESDRRRDAELAAAGVQVVRVTWRQIVDEPHVTLVLVAQALARPAR
jgi:very-short-patch-repair endonuclease